VATDLKIPAVFVRGGTSRAVLFHARDLARFDAHQRDAVILTALGSPDPNGRQVDGLGGGISSLSKAAIIAPSGLANTDIEFDFAQVDVERPLVDWSGTCGNISSAVGPFAIDEGLVDPVEPVTKVRVLAVNTGKRFVAHVPVVGGRAVSEGDFVIDGVPGSGARIELEYVDPASSLGRGVLPTGVAQERLALASGRHTTVSIVDVAIPTVFVLASDVGGDATGTAAALDADTELQRLLEEIRCSAAVQLGLCISLDDAHERQRAMPKIAMVAPPAHYETGDGRHIEPTDTNLLARAISMERTHRTYPGSVSMATAVAAQVPGTVVFEAAQSRSAGASSAASGQVRIGHPAGVIPVDADVERDGADWRVPSVTTYRTARRIMEGHVLVPESRLHGAGLDRNN
jgi:2-methylaconitate cis-trans-isomerase PrpF